MGNTPINALPSDSQQILAPRKRKSSKPPAIKTAVTAKYIMGQSKAQIANDLGLARNTVTAILSDADLNNVVLEGRSRAIGYIHKSLDVVENRLNKNDGSVAISLLRGTQVLQNQPITVNQNNIQANTWITMRAQRSNEEMQLAIDVKPDEKPTE